MDTLATMRASIERWIGEKLEKDTVDEAINDAIQTLWQSIIQFHLSLFVDGPVNLNIAAASERIALTSVSDPATNPQGVIVVEESSAAQGVRQYLISYTYVTESGTETLESPILLATVPEGYLLVVQPPPAVDGAYGWNLYVASLNSAPWDVTSLQLILGVDAVVPGKLENLAGIGAGGYFTLDWDDPLTGNQSIDNIALEGSLLPGNQWSPTPQDGTMFWGYTRHLKGFRPNTGYYLRLAAHNRSGQPSDPSTAVDLGPTGWGPWTYVDGAGGSTDPAAAILVQSGSALNPNQLFSTVVSGAGYRRLRQNEQPLAFSDSFQEPPAGFNDDAQSLPLAPTQNTTADDIFYIRKLESQTPAGYWKAWEAADLDSLVMRRAGTQIATPSDYQSYAWDLINQNRIEIRPATGAAVVPRYFFIRRPRRLRYANAQIPFNTIPCLKYLRCQAMSDLSPTIYEYDAAEVWQKKADAEKAEILRAVIMQSRNKNQTVTPYLV